MSEHYRQLVSGVALESIHPAGRHWSQEMLVALDKVPMTQPPKAASDLTNVLKRMLEIHSDGTARVHVLKRAQKLAQPLLDGLYKQIMAESHPLPVAKANLAARVLEMRSLQGKNACMAVWELAGPDGKLPWLGRGQIVEAVNEALECMRDVLELSFQQYQEPPLGSWRRLHALYGFAVDVDIAQRKCVLPDNDVKHSARQRYAQALLLAMANPWGMQRAELAQASQICASLADRVHFDGVDEAVPVQGAGNDSGPGMPSADHHGDGLMMDLAPVLDLVDQQLSWDSDGGLIVSVADGRGGHNDVRRSMLERMSRAWRGRSERGYERVGGRHVMSVLVGMSAIHQAMAGGDDFDAFRERLAGGQIDANTGGNAAAWLSGHSAAEPIHVEAQVLDQSLGGYRLLWPAGLGHRVRIGELVGLIPGPVLQDDPDRSAIMMLGVLRWLRSRDHDQLAVGVELLSRQPQPAIVRVMAANGQRGPLQRGLLADAGSPEPELILARVREQQVEGAEISCLPEEGKPEGTGMRRRKFSIAQAQELSPAYYRVSLSDSDSSNTHSTAS